MRLKGKILKDFVILSATVMSVIVILTAGTTWAANWPEKGKLLTIYLSAGAGGSADMNVRSFQPYLEKELGIKTIAINKPGGAQVIGVTEFLNKSGTDGYTALAVTASTVATYLDPTRKATFTRKDFQLVASTSVVTVGLAVKKGRYKTLKDLAEAARANPRKISIAAATPLSTGDMAVYKLEQGLGVTFAHIPFDTAGEQRAALLGGHCDAEVNMLEELTPGHRSGEIEILTFLGERGNKFAPDIKSVVELGYPRAAMETYNGYAFKTGTPQEIVDAMGAAVKRAAANPDFLKQAEKRNVDVRVLVGKEYEDVYSPFEKFVKGLIDELVIKK